MGVMGLASQRNEQTLGFHCSGVGTDRRDACGKISRDKGTVNGLEDLVRGQWNHGRSNTSAEHQGTGGLFDVVKRMPGRADDLVIFVSFSCNQDNIT